MSKTIVTEIEFEIKQTVYLRTDPDQLPRLVAYIIVGNKEVMYGIKQGEKYDIYHDYEITAEKNIIV
ncbi:hypothetical protein [Myroides odoratus]|uniref:Uncharacterized protein n=1 Tax=Myroides odoratus TaxID=256 RepID=A0A9Q7E735_MYROD|nr:hypothetical protein [Myroides odoratus]EHQ41563.1 hypothetical protein Myrod_0727 [Myroides odoratus DSM 2801]EKB02740.1 hypothetical protein HMPREF9716_03673 [Myroides odoratus CIP 103059]QQT98980.1 hypothetical protein I6I88_12240 [Myroides odoratus]WQD58830.1 hypothetical protein U0010_06730 [Myroides odoratus]STZ28826.1 Uncharacterised protein [Myroides odoratus]